MAQIIIFFVFLPFENRHSMLKVLNCMANLRIKAVLAETGKTSRWLAEQLNKSENTVSRWCQNKVEPSITQLNEIADVLGVDIRSLICSNKKEVKENV